MAIEAQFADLMPDTIIVTPSTGNDAYGKWTYVGAVPVTFKGRIENKSTVLKDPSGNEIVTTGHVYLFGVSAAKIGDLLTLPDGSTPVLLSVNTNSDGTSAHHTVLFFGTEH